jgi:hypothetical protein
MFKKLSPKEKIVLIGGTIILLVAMGIALWNIREVSRLKNPAYQQQVFQKQNAEIIKTIGQLVNLPEGTPQVAVVANAETLKKNQPFFEKAMNGDEVLVYPDEAILYRPSIKKIIVAVPIIQDQSQTAPAPQGAPQPTPTPATKPVPVKK